MEDVKDTVLWTLQNTHKNAIENKNLFIMGYSAEAHMAKPYRKNTVVLTAISDF